MAALCVFVGGPPGTTASLSPTQIQPQGTGPSENWNINQSCPCRTQGWGFQQCMPHTLSLSQDETATHIGLRTCPSCFLAVGIEDSLVSTLPCVTSQMAPFPLSPAPVVFPPCLRVFPTSDHLGLARSSKFRAILGAVDFWAGCLAPHPLDAMSPPHL